MANYGMEATSMASQDVRSYNRSGFITGLSSSDTIPNGAFVVTDDATALTNDVYGITPIGLENFKKFTTSATATAYILDASAVPEVEDVNGNVYRIGNILTSLEFAYDKILRYRQLKLDDVFTIFGGNITGTAPTVGQFIVPTNASFLFTASASAGSSFAAVVEAIRPLNRGLTNIGSVYQCRVVQLN